MFTGVLLKIAPTPKKTKQNKLETAQMTTNWHMDK